MSTQKTHNDGQKDGADWGRQANANPWSGISGPSKPHEAGNEDYNKGVAKGVDDVGANRTFFPKTK